MNTYKEEQVPENLKLYNERIQWMKHQSERQVPGQPKNCQKQRSMLSIHIYRIPHRCCEYGGGFSKFVEGQYMGEHGGGVRGWGGLKTVLGVNLLVKLAAISQQACNFTKKTSYQLTNTLKCLSFLLLYSQLSYYLLRFRIARMLVFQSIFQWLFLLVVVITHTLIFSIFQKNTVHSYSYLPFLYNLSHKLTELNVSLFYFNIKLIFFRNI